MQTIGKRIVFVCQHAYPDLTSSGLHMSELASGLAADGWHVTVLADRIGASANAPRVTGGLLWNSVRFLRPRTSVGSRERLATRILASARFFVWALFQLTYLKKTTDVVLITTNPPFLPILIPWLKWLGVPVVLQVYDLYPDVLVSLGYFRRGRTAARVMLAVRNWAFARASVIVSIGRDMSTRLVDSAKVSPERIVEIPNWAPADLASASAADVLKWRDRNGVGTRFLVQYSGRMARVHNIEDLLPLAEILAEDDFLFQVIGEGAKRNGLQQEVARRGLRNFQFLPFQDASELPVSLGAADAAVVCLAPEFEGLCVPSKAYGIMASGRPIVALLPAGSEIALVIGEANCGVVCSDVVSAAAQLRRWSKDRREARVAGDNGRRAFLHRYTLRHAVVSYSKVLLDAQLSGLRCKE